MKRSHTTILVIIACLVSVSAVLLYFFGPTAHTTKRSNPLSDITFYRNDRRDAQRQADTYRKAGNDTDAQLMERISAHPDAIWLTGPSEGDPQAQKDIEAVKRTSREAEAQNKVVFYQLYAIPQRDACADYSKAGFENQQDYLSWIDRVLQATSGKAVFAVEADAVAHTVEEGCMTETERTERYDTLRQTLGKLKASDKVLASYLDAANADWMEPDQLVGALKQAGVDQARGVTVNVSNFVDTAKTTEWSARLAEALGGKVGVIIDTSRNGQGAVPADVTGDARWCNPSGRGIGPVPTTDVDADHVDAYMYIKTIGESDGACFGNAEAGVFVPELALELARNAKQ